MATAVNRQLHKEEDLPPTRPKPHRGGLPQDPIKTLALRVFLKSEEGDFKGTVRLDWLALRTPLLT